MSDTWEKNDFTVVKDDWQDDVEDDWDASEDDKPVVIEKKPTSNNTSAKPKKVAEKKEVVEEVVETELEKKLRLQRLQEASDMENAMALFGVEHMKSAAEVAPSDAKTVVVKEVDWLESLNPEAQKDFDAIVEKLSKKLKSFEKHKLYIPFVESLTRSLLQDRDVPDIRKLGSAMSDMASMKQKEKLVASKKPAPTLAGAKKSSRNVYADFGDFDDDGDGFD